MQEEEECDHHWITDVQLGDFVECEICGLIFPKTQLYITAKDMKKAIKMSRELVNEKNRSYASRKTNFYGEA